MMKGQNCCNKPYRRILLWNQNNYMRPKGVNSDFFEHVCMCACALFMVGFVLFLLNSPIFRSVSCKVYEVSWSYSSHTQISTFCPILWRKVGICNICGSVTHFPQCPTEANYKIHKFGLGWPILCDCSSFYYYNDPDMVYLHTDKISY